MSALAVLLAFCLGAVLGGQLFARLAGADLRGTGSGNLGATNALRAGGLGLGLAVLVFDLAKGVLSAALIPTLAPHSTWLPWACAAAAVLGHVYSPLARFSGGKGAATLVGAYAALLPIGLALALPVFLLVVVITGYVSLAVLTGGLIVLIYAAAIHAGGPWSLATLFAGGVWLFLCWTHRGNIERLARGTEHRFRRAMLLRRDDAG